ncbi:hypothetical protein M9H77_25471 [Catharanthus roseus]|uniref:Uncharacterized protein n=1 Tax=Catharanthus roseus TaxID=4058 RepID=A0ACC0AB75_CATRO|nr:hypothetical protein M9H77_25471 [Catharanthus roseus]
MEEVLAHVHPGPIVPDFIWLPNLDRVLVPSDLVPLSRTYDAPVAWAQMVPDACDTPLDLHQIQLRGNDHTYWETQHASHIEACTSGDFIYLCLIWTAFMLQEVDDMASVVIQQPPTDPSQMAVFAKKVQMIIRRCMTFPVQPSHRRPREHVLDRGNRGVKRGAHRLPGRGVGGGRPPVPPIPHRHEHVDPEHVEVERGEGSGGGQPTVDPFDSPNWIQEIADASPSQLGFASFQAPHSTSFGFFGFRAPPPLGTVGSSTPHQPISQASSSDEEEQTDDMDGVQHYGFRHRVGKKTTRFTPSEWP